MKKLLSLLIGIMICAPAMASIGVSPTKLEIDANKIKTNYATTAIEIKGDAQNPMRFKAYTGYFKINEKAEVILIEKSDEPQNIAKKVRFVPSEFTVAPGKSQKLRVNIANINTLPDGESRAMLYIEDVNPQEYAMPLTDGIGAQLLVKTRVGVPIYVDKGKVNKVGEIETFEVIKQKDGYYTKMKILSKGNAKIRCNTRVQVIKGKKLVCEYGLDEKVVGENNYHVDIQKMNLKNVMEPGEYTVRAVMTYTDGNGNRKNVKKETVFNIVNSEL